MKVTLTELGQPAQAEFLGAIEELSGQNISACYQCGKCTGGCPVIGEVQASPSQVIHLVQLGLKEQALRCPMIWSCAGCYTCTTRCPIGIDLAKVMDALRDLALREDYEPSDRDTTLQAFIKAFLDSIREYGRLSEACMMGSYNVNSGKLFTNLNKAPAFLFKGKVAMLPHRVTNIGRMRRMFKRIEEIEGKTI